MTECRPMDPTKMSDNTTNIPVKIKEIKCNIMKHMRHVLIAPKLETEPILETKWNAIEEFWTRTYQSILSLDS